MVEYMARHLVPAALDLLPANMTGPRATAMLLAIGLQESRFQHRRQVNGPARGFWQFERAGVVGVLMHRSTSGHVRTVLGALAYDADADEAEIQAALEHNDVLAAAVARLLLWTVPGALPGPGDAAVGWAQYVEGWRPGRPRPETWRAAYQVAWDVVGR